MTYNHTVSGTFIRRPNRFLAHVQIDGRETVCHVKNTGRLREFLIPGASLILEYHPDAAAQGRKTSYSVIGVYKEQAGYEHRRLLINMDSQAPNQAAAEWVAKGGLNEWLQNHGAMEGPGSPTNMPIHSISSIRREVVYGGSRFDLAFLLNSKQAFMEVKGVTLEQDGLASFPDAPTERGVKHVEELIRAAKEGHPAFLLFVIQMKGIRAFTPNRSTHPAFADALQQAAASGVHLLAYDCLVTEHSMHLDKEIPVIL